VQIVFHKHFLPPCTSAGEDGQMHRSTNVQNVCFRGCVICFFDLWLQFGGFLLLSALLMVEFLRFLCLLHDFFLASLRLIVVLLILPKLSLNWFLVLIFSKGLVVSL
jgi:hypothetical protein